MRKLSVILKAFAAITLVMSPALAELGSNNPPDDQLLTQRETETGCTANPALCTPPSPTSPALSNSGNFDIAPPPAGTKFSPVLRVRRDQFGAVGRFMLQNGLTESALDALVYPNATASEKNALVEGLQFFTTFHTASQGLGPINNQPACIGCHLNSADAIRSRRLLQGQNCTSASSNCSNASNVTRAARSTPTNFEFTSLDTDTGGGVAADNLDAIHNTGKTAAFTTFGDFDPTHADASTNPNGIGFFDPLDGATTNIVTGSTSQPFGGFVQHTRPALVPECVPKPLPPASFDSNLTNPQFHRSVGERAGPPYIGRGLIEAVPTDDITANTVPSVENGKSSLGSFASLLCPSSSAGCISGVTNMIPRNFNVRTTGTQAGTVTGFVGGVGRFGLRANGVEMLQFIVGGEQGELSFTTLLNGAEINFPTLFPSGTAMAPESAECYAALSQTLNQPYLPPGTSQQVNLNNLEAHLSIAFSIRNLLRNTAPPEFGDALLDVLRTAIKSKPWLQNVSWQPDKNKGAGRWQPGSEQAKVKRGAELFGIDLVAFANRTIGVPMTAGGDSRDDNAINQTDRKLNCVGCHTPIQKTGQSPAEVGAEHLTYVWAPIFSDLLIHHMPVVDAERYLVTKDNLQPLPRDPLVIARLASSVGEDGYYDPKHGESRFVDTFDLPRNLADDTFTNSKASAEGSQFRTAPLMGLGRIGPPFLHDARVYLSKDTVKSTPAGTVTTNLRQTNAPLVVNSVDDAILAAIELHDLPAPDDRNTPRLPGAGCPVPPKGSETNIDYGSSPKSVICPAYGSATSNANRSDSAEVMYRFRQLSPNDQQAVIEFLKQL